MIRSIFKLSGFGGSNSGSGNGLPLEVADEAARLALTPVSGMRVKQADTGMVWGYEGGNYYPAPILDYNLDSGQVLQDQVYKSQDYPAGGSGTFIPITFSGTILPHQKFSDNIVLFIGVGAVDIEDTEITYVSPYIVLDNFAAQIGDDGSANITLDCALTTENVDAILEILDSHPGAISGIISLLGDNGAPTARAAVTLPGSVANFGGTYPVNGSYNGNARYAGTSDEAPNNDWEIRWDAAGTKWEIVNVTTSDTVLWSEATSFESNPWDDLDWYDSIGVTSVSLTQGSMPNAFQQSLTTKGLTIYTN